MLCTQLECLYWCTVEKRSSGRRLPRVSGTRLRPAFRLTAHAQLHPMSAVALRSKLRLAIKLFADKLRSTFVVIAVGDGAFFRRSLASLAVRLLFRPDLIFVLTADEEHTFFRAAREVDYGSTAAKGRAIYLNASLSTDENVQQASQIIVRWLAARQEMRLSLESGHWAKSSVDPREENLHKPAGLHLVVK